MVADGCAVFDGNAAFFIDEYAQRSLSGQFEIDQFIAQAGQGFFEDGLNIHAAP